MGEDEPTARDVLTPEEYREYLLERAHRGCKDPLCPRCNPPADPILWRRDGKGGWAVDPTKPEYDEGSGTHMGEAMTELEQLRAQLQRAQREIDLHRNRNMPAGWVREASESWRCEPDSKERPFDYMGVCFDDTTPEDEVRWGLVVAKLGTLDEEDVYEGHATTVLGAIEAVESKARELGVIS